MGFEFEMGGVRHLYYTITLFRVFFIPFQCPIVGIGRWTMPFQFLELLFSAVEGGGGGGGEVGGRGGLQFHAKASILFLVAKDGF